MVCYETVVRIDDLRTFLAVLESGGVSRAASKLGLAQSTVSDRMSHLQESLGPLFGTEAGRVTLTLLGERILPVARQMVALADELVSLPAKATGHHHRVRIGANETVAHTWLIPWLAALRAERPSLAFDVTIDTTDALENLMKKGHLDIWAGARRFTDSRVQARKVGVLEMSFVGGSRYMKPLYTLDELARSGFVTFSPDTQPCRQLRKLLKDHGLAARIDCFSSIAAMLRAVEAGFGIATLPRAVAEQGGSGSTLRVLQCKALLRPLPVFVSWVAGKSSRDAHVIEHLLANLRVRA